MRFSWYILAITLLTVFVVACGGTKELPTAQELPSAVSDDKSVATQLDPISKNTDSSAIQPIVAAKEKEFGSSTQQGSLNEKVLADASDAVNGGSLIRLGSDPPTLDPHVATDSVSIMYINEIYGGLVTLDLDLNVVPDLAESWEVSDNGRTYTFHLRPNISFHNGKPVTASDVKWSFERVSDPNTQSPVAETYLGDILGVQDKLAGSSSSVVGVEVIDDRTVSITINEPKAYFLSKLTYPTSFILDENSVTESDDWMLRPNGTGPFRLWEYETGEVLRLSGNEGYHLGAPYLDEVEFILAGGQGMLMYESDEIHLTGVGRADLSRILDPNEPLNSEAVQAPAAFSVAYIGMNVNEPPFDDPNIRLALNYAFDRHTIADVVLEGLRIPAQGIIPPGFPAFNPDLDTYTFDTEKAKQLVRDSKYGSDLSALPRITLNVVGGFGAPVDDDIEAIRRAWEVELGIIIDIQQTAWATFLQDLHDRRYQMFKVGWGADYPDPENFLDILFHSSSDNNHSSYNNPQVDALLEQARVERNQDTRFELYNRIEQMIIDEAPWIPLWNSGTESYALVKPYVKGFYMTPMSIPIHRYIYIDK
ncbi:MAG: peptide ABC transporter substrate-binding protein [Chloroflexota bacterium]|nr:peptide ABC transporter substrate-binding protein [Chloroflexota bacterium]